MRPLLIKELRGYLRSSRPFTILTIFLVLLSAPLLLFYAEARSTRFGDVSEVGQMVFVVVNIVALVQLTILTPSNTAGAVCGERERQTLDLLLVTPLSSRAIVFAKLAAPVLYLILLALATLPISALAFFVGGVTLSDLLISFVVMVTAAVGYGAVGIVTSAFAKSSKGATVLALGITTFAAVGLPVLLFIMEQVLDDGAREGNMSLFQGPLLALTLPAISLSPFASFALVFRRVVEGGPLLTTELPTNEGDIAVPALWLVSLAIWALLALLLLALSARRLRRDGGELG